MVLLTVIVGTFLGRLDQTIVNLALPKMIDTFGITVTSAGWISTAYILANAIFVPIWGKLGDTIGRKKVYLIGFSIFILGSVLAGFAWNLSSMIVFRVIQAIAGSADYPTAMAIIAVTFKEGKDRAKALGIWSGSFAAAAVFGPLLGGPLIDIFGWRSVFLINLPIGILGIYMAMRYIHESRSDVKTKSFDWWGAISLGVSLSALVLVLEKGLSWGWLSAYSLLSYAVTAIFLVLFVYIERNHEEPIVDLKFFKIPAFVNVLMNNFIVFMGMMGSMFLLPVFAQTFLGYTATETGFLFMPMVVAMMSASVIGGNLTGKISSRMVIFWSTLIAAIGTFLFVGIDAKSTALDLIFPLMVMAFGLGLGMAQRTNIIASLVDPHEIGIASSLLALVRNIAGAFGIAIFATYLTKSIERNVLTINHWSTLHTTDPTTIATYIKLIILKAQINAYKDVYVLAAVVILVGALTALTLKIKNENTTAVVHVE
ncbi:MAG TPA: DHA2 family efflux MFS transporter permease subunit [Candidatus Paceibacterota bacterium]|nr:DHA2 family efflux MFS transporter permease subunit [Candidatus Paceibacterota bacterium]